MRHVPCSVRKRSRSFATKCIGISTQFITNMKKTEVANFLQKHWWQVFRKSSAKPKQFIVCPNHSFCLVLNDCPVHQSVYIYTFLHIHRSHMNWCIYVLSSREFSAFVNPFMERREEKGKTIRTTLRGSNWLSAFLDILLPREENLLSWLILYIYILYLLHMRRYTKVTLISFRIIHAL